MKKINKILNKIWNVILKINGWIYYPIILQVLLLTGLVFGESSIGVKAISAACIILDSFIIIINCKATDDKEFKKIL